MSSASIRPSSRSRRDQGRGYSFDRHHPRRTVPAAHVECRRRHRSCGARYRSDPLVHRIPRSWKSSRRSSSAVAEREDIALLQFRTASGVLAHINTNWLTPFKARTVHVATRDKYLIGDLLTRQVTECFGFQPDGSYSMRHLSVGHAEPLRAELLAFVNAIRERRARRRSPATKASPASKSRSAASTGAPAAAAPAQGAAARRGLTVRLSSRRNGLDR